MSARVACLECGDSELRHGVATGTDTGRRVPILICKCGLFIVTQLSMEAQAANLAMFSEKGAEVGEAKA